MVEHIRPTDYYYSSDDDAPSEFRVLALGKPGDRLEDATEVANIVVGQVERPCPSRTT